MKITASQIEKIEETLLLNGIIYEDIKLELTDHIASEIEFKMTENLIEFEIALKEAFENWQEELKPKTYGFLLGNNYTGAKIYMDRALKFTRNEYKWLFILVIILLVVKAFDFDITFTEEEANSTRIIIKIVLGIVFSITLYARIILKKFKTTFSEIFKKRFNLSIVYFIAFMVGAFPILPSYGNEEGQIIPLYFLMIYMLYTFNNWTLLVRHFKTKKQFEKSLC